MNRKSFLVWAGIFAAGALIWATGSHTALIDILAHRKPHAEKAAAVAPPTVTIARVEPADFVETVLATGSLVAREEVLVAPEVEGLRIVEIKVEEGDTVEKGDILAVLETEALDAQIAQNAASLARSTAAIAQAESQITEVEARLAEAKASLERAKPLTKKGYLSESVLDQRQAQSRSLAALLMVARNGLTAAEAEKTQVEAQRRELEFRRSRTNVRAPVGGLISRRTARIGAIASAASATVGQPMFRIIQDGEIELDAEVGEADLRKIAIGQTAQVEVAGELTVPATVRLVSPEVDPETRLGRVRLLIGNDARLRIGTFASGTIETTRGRGLAVPVSAISTDAVSTTALVVENSVVALREVKTGLSAGGLVQIVKGLAEGERVVARAGTFLKDGDKVRAVEPPAGKVSAAR